MRAVQTADGVGGCNMRCLTVISLNIAILTLTGCVTSATPDLTAIAKAVEATLTAMPSATTVPIVALVTSTPTVSPTPAPTEPPPLSPASPTLAPPTRAIPPTPVPTKPLPQPPAPAPQRIQFAPGTDSATFTAHLKQGVAQSYVLWAQAGQDMLVSADDPASVSVVNLLTPQGDSVQPDVSGWRGKWEFYQLPETGNYTLVLLGRGKATITIIIPPLEPISASTPATCTRIRFAPGAASLDFTVELVPDVPQCYLVRALQGQQMIITAFSELYRPSVLVFGPSGSPMTLSRLEGMIVHWVVDIPQTGDYTVVLLGEGETWVTIDIPPR